MTEVGACEAKTHLAKLLRRVAEGDRILITHRGKPVAMLVPPEKGSEANVAAIVRGMLAQREQQGPKLGRGLSARKLIEEGRRF